MLYVAIGVVLASLALSDMLFRRIPSALALSLLGLISIFWSLGFVEITPLGALVGLIGTVGARLPGGDSRAATLAGMIGGPLITALALLIAHGLVAVRWRQGKRGFPWVPYFAAPLGVLVMTHGQI